MFGAGLRGAPTREQAVEFSLNDLRRLPAVTIPAFVECGGNGHNFFATQQNSPVLGTQRRLGDRCRPLARRPAGHGAAPGRPARHTAVDVLPAGLDAEVISNGVNLGHVRRPLPIAKARHEVLLAYEVNGEPLPSDHGHPVRLIVPSWIGIANIKWLGEIEVPDMPLFSPFRSSGPSSSGAQAPIGGAV